MDFQVTFNVEFTSQVGFQGKIRLRSMPRLG